MLPFKKRAFFISSKVPVKVLPYSSRGHPCCRRYGDWCYYWRRASCLVWSPCARRRPRAPHVAHSAGPGGAAVWRCLENTRGCSLRVIKTINGFKIKFAGLLSYAQKLEKALHVSSQNWEDAGKPSWLYVYLNMKHFWGHFLAFRVLKGLLSTAELLY